MKLLALSKRIISNNCDIGRYRNTCKGGTSSKRTICNCCNLRWYLNIAPYTTVIIKNIIYNNKSIFICKTYATLKGRRSDARHTIWNCNTRKATTIRKGKLLDARHTIRNYNTRKTTATIERSGIDDSYIVRDYHTLKRTASRKR